MTVRCGLMSARIRSSAEDGSGCFELLELPSDTLTSVLQKLTYEDLVRVGTTCRTLRQLVDDDMMWIGFCKQWERQLDITTWHPRMKSAKSLFRLLRSFDKLVGSWQAKQQGPQGGLLYITWGDVSLEALRVLPLAAGNLKFVPLFQVVGMLDGTSRVELLTMRGLGNHWEVWLPGAVVWSPTTANEFHLERFERGHELHRPAAAENKNDVTRRLHGDDSEREVDGVNGAVIWPGRNIMGMMIVDEQQNYMMRLLQMQQRLTVQNLALRSEPAINSRSLPSHSMSEYGQVTHVVLPAEQFGVLMGNPILARSSCQQEDEGPCSIYWDLIISEPTHLQMLEALVIAASKEHRYADLLMPNFLALMHNLGRSSEACGVRFMVHMALKLLPFPTPKTT
ncbi:unnamed protein product [Sphagnum jensenii]|uniref:F-box domain-containing protein n=1 Tax=Sphagnum jensenii TaxID=128206 RepID=A0ABP0XFE4_9BRYO